MTDEPIPASVQAIVDAAASDGAMTVDQIEKEQKFEPSYKMIGSAKIPVSKAAGELWKSRIRRADEALKPYKEKWDEVQKYFDNDQSGHRQQTDGDRAGNEGVAKSRNRILSETENVVYSNIMAMVPMLYAKNPEGEITPQVDQHNPLTTMAERLINTLAAMKTAPGINLKPKLRRAIPRLLLRNEAWMLIGYTLRENSDIGQMDELNALAEELEKAKDQKEIVEIEGKLMALEEASDFLNPPGPVVRLIDSHNILIDPDSETDDLSDAKWVAYYDYLPTAYVQAKYGEKNEQGQYHSIYSPTHVLKNVQDTNEAHQDFEHLAGMDNATEHEKHGYGSESAYRRNTAIKVCYVWDKVTRRLMMFNTDCWTYPIWVWNDPYGLKRFFPLYKTSFGAHTHNQRGRGEVSMYLDQQDAINEINDEWRRARLSIKRRVVYNKNVIKDGTVIENLVNEEGNQATYGVDAPPDTDMSKLWFTPPIPALQAQPLFDKTPVYAAMDRIAGVTDVLRGAQFKTNTTNKAVDTYNSIQSSKLDEKIDAIEDFVGEILNGVLFLCIKFMDAEEVARILGDPKYVQMWEEFKRLSDERMITYRVTGGSTQKPTSAAKRSEAMEMGQVLGQFASASPAVLLTVLRMFERAFDDFIIKAEDWQMIMQSIMGQMQPQGGDPAQQGGGEIKPNPEQEAAIKKAIDRGVPPEEAIKRVMQMTSGAGDTNGRPN